MMKTKKDRIILHPINYCTRISYFFTI